jgi:hypothetical protein
MNEELLHKCDETCKWLTMLGIFMEYPYIDRMLICTYWGEFLDRFHDFTEGCEYYQERTQYE